MELLAVSLIFGLALGYLGRRIYSSLTSKNPGCCGCSHCHEATANTTKSPNNKKTEHKP